MATTIDMMLDELQTHRVALALPLEGFRDYVRLNLKEPAKAIAVAGVDAYATRLALTVAAIDALLALSDSDYPAMPRFAAPADAKTDFDNNDASVSAANAQVDLKAPPAIRMETEFTVTNQ